jgi:hypothetical protein
MPPDDPREAAVPAEIVWPTREQMEKGLTQIERYAPLWKASPALLVIKPDHGLIVSLESIEHDRRHFELALVVEEAIVAPEAFDTQILIKLQCVWNQPYMSLGADCISAPYSFYLHFGAHGVQRAREFSKTRAFEKLRNSPLLLGLLGSCFQADFQLPAESGA